MPPKRLATLLKDHRVEQGLTRVMLAQLLEDPALTGLLTEAWLSRCSALGRGR